MRLAMKGLLTAAALIVVAPILTLAIPVESWRTGRIPAPPINVVSGGPQVHMSPRIWIDTDAACGASRRSDPDDCFAIALLARATEMRIAGISTIFGNADLAITDRTTRDLALAITSAGIAAAPVYRGAAADTATSGPAVPGVQALQHALAEGPMTIVALGPLTNIALALRDRPDLAGNVSRIVAVMGRQPGHVFHPAEGHKSRALLGHGPVFRDLNFVKDVGAAAAILSMRLPVTLVPYDVARHVLLTRDDLRRIEQSSRDLAWIARRSHDWLRYWETEIGRNGFYPFDLLAAAYAIDPKQFYCATFNASVARDETLFFSWLYRPHAMLVNAGEQSAQSALARGPVIYCPQTSARLHDWLMRKFEGVAAADRPDPDSR